MAAGGDAVEAEAMASGDVAETEATSGAVSGADSGARTSFKEEEDSEKTVSEEEEPEAALVDPLVAQFVKDDGWYHNILDFVQ